MNPRRINPLTLFLLCAVTPTAPTSGASIPVNTAVEKPLEETVRKTVAIGQHIGRVTFKDIRFVPTSLADLGKKRALVLAFLDTHCPVAAKYAPRLDALWRKHRSRGVLVVGIYASPGDTMVAVAADALEKKLTFPVHKDFDQSALRALGVTRTPEVVVLDERHILRYRGRIDDQFRVAGSAPRARRHYLEEALVAVLDGKRPEVEETPVDGCVITTWKPPAREGLNYAEHVAPIVQKHCQHCHRPHQTAPFSLLTYDDVRKHAGMIAEVVEQRSMPPSYADPRYGRFTGHHPLTDETIEILASWARGDRAPGDPTKAPMPLVWPEGVWDIDTPNIVLESPEEFEIPATGYVDYKYVTVGDPFTHDTWINQIQILPGNRRVVHHANLYVRRPDGKDIFITGHVPGGDVTRYGRNSGVMVPAGCSLVLQIHYTTTGKPETDRTRVGIVYAGETIRWRTQCLYLINGTFEIPPLVSLHEVRHEDTFQKDVVGLALFVHMHLRGRDMTFVARYPDGRRETLLSVPNYNFDWQLAYRWTRGQKHFPAGTTIETISHYDNSEYNPFNPDPRATVREGRQSYHEMNYGFVFYFDENEDLSIEVDPATGRMLDSGRQK